MVHFPLSIHFDTFRILPRVIFFLNEHFGTDPVKTNQGLLNIRAYRLSADAMKLCYKDFTPERFDF